MASIKGRNSWHWIHYTRPMAYQRDLARGARCWICGGEIDYSATNNPRDPNYSKWAWEPDHVKDVATHPLLAEDITNVAPSHSTCNRRRNKKRRAADSADPRDDKPQDIGRNSRKWL